MMESGIGDYLKNFAIEQLLATPAGEKVEYAIHLMDVAQEHIYALAEKQGEEKMTALKAATVLTFALLRKRSDGKKIPELSNEDWKEVAKAVSQNAVIKDDELFSVWVFSMYERYIRYSIDQITPLVSESTVETINGLADELRDKADSFGNGFISEVAYIEDSMWIALEAMVKLLASTMYLTGDSEVAELSEALSAFAFEYGRAMLYHRELAIINEFLESQRQTDEELKQKFAEYLSDLEAYSEQFHKLIDNAFSPNFREAFLYSIQLAKAAGVKENEMLKSEEDIDAFFLD